MHRERHTSAKESGVAKMAELSSDVITESATEDTDVDVDGEACMDRAASRCHHYNIGDYHAWYIYDSCASEDTNKIIIRIEQLTATVASTFDNILKVIN